MSRFPLPWLIERSTAGPIYRARAAALVLCMIPFLTPPASAAPTAEPTAATAAATHAETAADPATKADPSANSDPNASASTASTLDPAAGGGDEPLLLEVFINGHSTGKIGEFVMRHGTLLTRPQELRDLGFRVPDSLTKGALIEVSSVPGLIWSLDEKNQTLHISVDNSALTPTLIGASGKPDAAGHRVIESGTGVTLNYDQIGNLISGQLSGSGTLQAQAFSKLGVLSSSWLTFTGDAASGSGAFSDIRLNSSFTYSDADRLRQFIVGDYITDALAWTQPVYMEGFKFHSNFALRPDLITFPLPSISGSAAVPGTINVLANGNLMLSSEVGSGPFQTPQLPVIAGAGNITLTVTNAMGQQVTVNQPFYASPTLLKPGLQDYAGQFGLVRRNWGSVGESYGKLAGAALYRRGITDKLTLEGGSEGTFGAYNGGGGAVYQVGTLGTVNFDASVSEGGGETGELYSVGAQHIGTILSVGGSLIQATKNYRNIATMNGEGVTSKQVSGFFTLASKRLGSAGVAYSDIVQGAPVVNFALNAITAQSTKLLSLNFSRSFHKINLYATDFITYSGEGNYNGLEAGINIPFGHRSSVDVSGTSDGIAEVQVQQSAPDIGDWGYNTYFSAGSSYHEFGQLQYKSPIGLFYAGVDTGDGATTYQVEAQGALSYVDHAIFPSNTIYDSFAIVDTNPMKNVRVYQENRDVGTTGKSGRLLVPDMRSYDENRISISPTDIPLDITLDNDKKIVRPQFRSGVIVKFPMEFSRGALIRLADEKGVAIPVGSTATLLSTGIMFPVGYDGEAYVKNLGDRNEISVQMDDGSRCSVRFTYKPTPGQVPVIGPLRCVEQKK